jgi:RNA recognition motif-containing protein
MGDIETGMDENYIKELYKNIANVVSVKIMKKVGLLVGYCFIEFESPEIAHHILENYNGKTVNGKMLKLSKAVYSGKSQQASTTPSISQNEVQIYVCDMEISVTEDELRDFFSKYYSSVISSKIVLDPKTRLSKGYGFVRFKDPNEANRALTEMNGKMLKSKPIKVK